MLTVIKRLWDSQLIKLHSSFLKVLHFRKVLCQFYTQFTLCFAALVELDFYVLSLSSIPSLFYCMSLPHFAMWARLYSKRKIQIQTVIWSQMPLLVVSKDLQWKLKVFLLKDLMNNAGAGFLIWRKSSSLSLHWEYYNMSMIIRSCSCCMLNAKITKFMISRDYEEIIWKGRM